jgi:hypothetical protein
VSAPARNRRGMRPASLFTCLALVLSILLQDARSQARRRRSVVRVAAAASSSRGKRPRRCTGCMCGVCVRVRALVCVHHACVHSCVRTCVRARVRARARLCVSARAHVSACLHACSACSDCVYVCRTSARGLSAWPPPLRARPPKPRHAAATTQDAGACSLLPSDFSQVDWSAIKTACGPQGAETFCPSCICGVGRGLVSGLYCERRPAGRHRVPARCADRVARGLRVLGRRRASCKARMAQP